MLSTREAAPASAEQGGQAVEKSRRQDHEELAESIGRPDPPAWGGVILTGSLALALGGLALVGVWLAVRESQGIGYQQAGGPAYCLLVPVAGVLVLVGVLAVSCLGLFRRSVERRSREQERLRRLAEVTAKDPGFAPFYEEWCRLMQGV